MPALKHTSNDKLYYGKKIGRLTILFPDGQDIHGKYMWLCGCRCGWYSRVIASRLLSSRAPQSCYQCKPQIRFKVEYVAWSNMIKRCYNPEYESYHRYGGRGIKICDRWREDFFNFLEDVGLKESSDLSLDRIDNDGNYEPNNCRWASKSEQAYNRS